MVEAEWETKPQRVLGYLSGAPRVSTDPRASASGPRSHVLGVIKGFEALGWKVQRFIFGDEVPKAWLLKEAEVELAASPLARLGADLVRLAFSAVNTWRAPRLLGKVDWVYERFGVFQSLGFGFQKKGVPWIVETNGPFAIEASQDRKSVYLSRLQRAMEVWVYKRADAIVAVSDQLKTLLCQYFGLNPDKIVVVPNGVDTLLFSPKSHQARASHSYPVIGFVGTLSVWQALDLLLEAIALLRGEGVEYRVIVVGEGQVRKAWEEKATLLGLGDRVTFVGRVPMDEVPNWIAQFDLGYVGPIPTASGVMYHSPLKLYEYMAMAKPVIAADYSETRSLLGENGLGYLFTPGSVDDLVRVLRKAYGEREWWPSMGEAARHFVVQNHSWEARVQQMVTQIEDILISRYGSAYPARGRG